MWGEHVGEQANRPSQERHAPNGLGQGWPSDRSTRGPASTGPLRSCGKGRLCLRNQQRLLQSLVSYLSYFMYGKMDPCNGQTLSVNLRANNNSKGAAI